VELKDWAAKKDLKEEETSRQEIAELFRLADQNLQDCKFLSTAPVSDDLYHACVYQAALPLAKASLRAEGYRVPSAVEKGHIILLDALTFTVDKTSKYTNPLQAARVVRNQTIYTSVSAHTKSDIDKLLKTVQELRVDIENWLRKKHPELFENADVVTPDTSE
jgi:ribosome-binding factor A